MKLGLKLGGGSSPPDPDDDYGMFRYKISAHGLVFFTNSYQRWHRHYKMCKRLHIPGMWYKWDDRVKHGTPQYWPKAKVVVSATNPVRLPAGQRDKGRHAGQSPRWRFKRLPVSHMTTPKGTSAVS